MTTPPPARNPALRILDIVVGSLVAVFALVFGFATVTLLGSFQPDAAVCVEGCDRGSLSAILIAGIGVEIFAWALSVGFFLVRIVRRRLAFYWPILGLIVMIVAFYATSAGISAWAAGTGVTP